MLITGFQIKALKL